MYSCLFFGTSCLPTQKQRKEVLLFREDDLPGDGVVVQQPLELGNPLVDDLPE